MMDACRYCEHRGTLKSVASGIKDWEYRAEGLWGYVQCSNCGGIFVNPFPALEQLVAAYPPDYDAFVASQEHGQLYSTLHRIYIKFLLLPRWKNYARPGGRLLDVGCGDGSHTLLFRKLGMSELHGVDFNPIAAERASKKGIKLNRGLFLDTSYPQEYFDLILMTNYLEHTLDPRAELGHAVKLLTQGGWLVGELPNFKALDRLIFGRYWGGNHVPRHTFQFTRSLLERLLREAGFNEVIIRPSWTPTNLAISLQNIAFAAFPNYVKIRNGRVRWFALAMMMSLPFHTIYSLFGLSGHLFFAAKK